MEPTLFSFIWKYSKKQQLVLLLLTVLSFPFLYASLELPKQIINDAIGAPADTVTIWGITVTPGSLLVDTVRCLSRNSDRKRLDEDAHQHDEGCSGRTHVASVALHAD